jgi:hypothetical protein
LSSVANSNGTLVHPAVRGWPEGRDYIEVYVSAVANPGLFWIQPLSSTSVDLDDLVDRITSLYTSEMSKTGGIDDYHSLNFLFIISCFTFRHKLK